MSYNQEFSDTVYLDSEVRNWILLPIFAIMILVGIMKNLINKIVSLKRPVALKEAKERSLQLRVRTLRDRFSLIPKSSFNTRRKYMIEKIKSLECMKPRENAREQANPMEDPEMLNTMKDMLMKNLVTVIPQTLVMTSITYFFAGLIIVKLPFPLTVHYKTMLQRGIETQDMDPRWVSSFSWYFLNLFGLEALYNLILDSRTDTGGISELTGMGAGFGKAPDMEKVFKEEIEQLELVGDYAPLEGIEKKIINMYKDFILVR